MSILINYKNNILKAKISNLIFFVDEKFSLTGLKKYFTDTENRFINDVLKSHNLSKKIISFDISSKKKIFLISVKSTINPSQVENLGAKFFNYSKDIKQKEFVINSDIKAAKLKDFVGHFLHGLKLKSYVFEKYKTKKNKKIITFNVIGKNIPSTKDQIKFRAIEEGIFYTRDLVSEPGNVLHPDEYAKRLKLLKKDGLKITVYDERKLKKLGMNTLLGVGQGSTRGSYLVTMEWKGLKDNSKPLAFVGKGVCFDTGGISLKPAKFMEDMTYDMAGSGVVV